MLQQFLPLWRLVSVAIVVGTPVAAPIDDRPEGSTGLPDSDLRRATQRALEPLNDWVGEWRGVGQPKRGSNKGAWTEVAEWSWTIGRDRVGMELKVKEGRYLQTGLLTYNASDKKFHLAAMMPEGQSREYQGELLQERKLVLTSKPSQDEGQHRLTIQLRHEDRLLLLMEAKSAGQGSFARVAEVGYTRKGGSFARAANAGPKCIVTDGRGSIAVDYKGKTYYVCCSGCKTAFLDDPEGIIAEAAQRAKQNQDSRN